MFHIGIGTYELSCQADGTPSLLPEYQNRAALAEEFELEDASRSSLCFCAVRRRDEDWPFLVVLQRYAPDAAAGFHPGILLVPETQRLFIGAGQRLLAYDLSKPARLWQDEADTGFWFWSVYDDIVLMAAELELAAWDTRGRKLWSRFVEPPWQYRVEEESVVVDVMGTVSRFDIRRGIPV